MTCKKCGNELTEGAKFCGHCGTKVQSNESVVEKEETTENKIEMENSNTGIWKYTKYIGIAYLVAYAIMLRIIYSILIETINKIAFNGLLKNIIPLVIMGGVGWGFEKIEEYLKYNYTCNDIWLFGISINKRLKIAKAAKILEKILATIASIMILVNMVSIYKTFGFSWMLALAVNKYLGWLVAVEIFSVISLIFGLASVSDDEGLK